MNASAQHLIDKKNELSATGKTVVDLVATEAKNLDPREMKQTAASLTTNARDSAAEAFSSTVGFVRRNPVGTALGLCVFGFIAGVITGHVRKAT
jgi:hypothetical protein